MEVVALILLGMLALVLLLITVQSRQIRNTPPPMPPAPPVAPPAPSLLNESHLRHQPVVNAYRSMLTQHIATAASGAANHDGVQDIAALETVTRSLCEHLFGAAEPAVQAILQTGAAGLAQAEDLCRRANALRAQAGALVPAGAWDFEFHQGFPLDPTRQEPWLDYDPQAPVTSVVSPAYVVDGRALCPQRVSTTSRSLPAHRAQAPVSTS